MSNGMLPSYLSMAKPNPADKRAPWFKGTAPVYAGIFLWVVFYMKIADGTLSKAGLGLSLLGLVVGALICYFLFYLVPGLLGMKTGYPLYVVGSSTYGTVGGFLMPGLLMGLLQFGWLAVNSAVSTSFILQALGYDASPGTPKFIIVSIIWTVLAVFVALKGIQYVGKVSTYLPIVPLVMILLVFFTNVGSAGNFKPALGADASEGFLTIITIVVGFFATAGAAGVDFGMGNRDAKDVQLGGVVGIMLAIIVAGGLPLIAVAGAHAANPAMTSFSFDAVISAQGGLLAKSMFVLFAIASFAPACFSTFIAANSIGTMFPKTNKVVAVSVGGIVAIVLAATGWALNLIWVFSIIGASFGPICGAMVADYFLSGRKWAGPRKGVNLAGYISWAIGFVVAILPTINAEKFGFISPAPVIAFFIGLVVYAVLAKAGLQPAAVEMTSVSAATAVNANKYEEHDLSRKGLNMEANKQVVIAINTKSIGIAFILTFFFGPLGMFYSTVVGGIVMLLISILVGILTFGFGLFITQPVCIIWGMIAANMYNKKLLASATPSSAGTTWSAPTQNK